MSEKLTKKHAVSALKKVTDPELGLDIYTLELIYDINLKDDDSVVIKMTLTSPMCPYGPSLMNDVKDKLKQKGFKNPEIDLVFEPIWEPSEKVKMLLGLQ
ncbi:metal-sulfur cluster assembly factor [Candidatus Pacearchaeota archaeon]|nr:metal-sulfur cluster assembly factor [Candidatus Pacearchaeota archaeon]